MQPPQDSVTRVPFQSPKNKPFGSGCVAAWVVTAVAAFFGLQWIAYELLKAPKLPGRRAVCASHLKQLGAALLMYAEDHDDRLPLPHEWEDEIYPFVKVRDTYVCPSLPKAASGYAYNRLLSGRPRASIASTETVPALYDTTLGIPSGSDELQSFATRHRNKGNVVFADGHAKTCAAPPRADAGLNKKAPP